MENRENTSKFASDYVDAVERKLRLRKRKQLAIVLALVVCLPLIGLTMLFAGPKKYIDGDDISVTYDTVLIEEKAVIAAENELELMKKLVATGEVSDTETEQLLAEYGINGKNASCVQTSSGYIQISYELSGHEYTLGMSSDMSTFRKTSYDTKGLFSRVRYENDNNEIFVKNITSLDKESLSFDAEGLLKGRWRERQNRDD